MPPTANSPMTWLHVTACFRSSHRDYGTKTIVADQVCYSCAAVVGAFAVGNVSRDGVKTVLNMTLRLVA